MATSLLFAGLTIPPAKSLPIPPAASLNATARPRQLAAAGSRAIVPVTYGVDRVPALILNVLVKAGDATKVLVQCLWGHECSYVDEFKMAGEDLPAGSAATSYTGYQVTADASLVAAFAAQGITYADTLYGYAYSVLEIPVKEFDGQLDISARVFGRKLYDPRKDTTAGGSGSHRLANPSTWEYVANPSLALADWLASTLYGPGEAVLWSSVGAAANANDALVGSPSEARRVIGWTISDISNTQALADTLRAYAGCWLVPTAGGLRLIADADASSVAHYSHAAGNIAAIAPLTLADLGNAPTVVEVVYTDTSQIPWRDATAQAVISGAGTTLPWRLSSVRLPGIQRYSQAYREAVERLNKLNLGNLRTTIEVFDIGISHERGDIVQLSYPTGPGAKPMRVTDVQLIDAGRWRLGLTEHDPAAYYDVVTTSPTYADTALVINGAGMLWADIAGIGKPSDYATSDAQLVATGTGLVLSGNNCDRPTGGGAWDAQVYSLDGYTGGAYCSFVPSGGTSSLFMAGLNSDPTTNDSYTSLDYAFFMSGTSTLYVWESNVDKGSVGTYAVGDVLAVTYDGSEVRYWQNGTALRAVEVGSGLRLFFDSSIHSYGLNRIRVGPMSRVAELGTRQLVDDAASTYASSYSAGSVSVPSNNTWVAVRSLSLTNDAYDLVISASGTATVAGAGGSGSGGLDLYAVIYDSNASTLVSARIATMAGPGSGNPSILVPWALNASMTVTYANTSHYVYAYVYWVVYGSWIGATVESSSNFLSAFERKR